MNPTLEQLLKDLDRHIIEIRQRGNELRIEANVLDLFRAKLIAAIKGEPS